MTTEDILGTIEKMTAMELSTLVKAIEDKFGVTAAAPVMVAGAGPAAGGGEEEKTEFTVVLKGFGEKKIDVIKAVREITGLGLGEAKALVEAGDKPVKENVSKDEAAKIKEKLTAVGATVELQ
ncbi:MAG: 50S ribosomal protein L7/L12 [Spirochaetia bacterium]